MDELGLNEVVSNDLAPSAQCDAIVTETRSSVLNKANRCVSDCTKVFLLKVN